MLEADKDRIGFYSCGHLPVTGRLNKVDAGVDTVVLELVAVDAVLLLEVVVETRLDVVNDGLPAAENKQGRWQYASGKSKGQHDCYSGERN